MSRSHPTRRMLARWMAGGIAAIGASGAALADMLDRGIGGTGVVSDPPPDPPSDRGIGGTGVIGTIRGFGSIVVNDRHIDYPPDASVSVDGNAAQVADLKLGHVVRVVARADGETLTTGSIAVDHEIVGRIDHVARHHLIVLGQVVLTGPRNGSPPWRRGDRVAVSGLRRPDGAVMASLIEPGAGAQDRVAGVIRRRRDGSMALGRLRVEGVTAALVGRRAVLSGVRRAGRFVAAAAAGDLDDLVERGVDACSIESYVQRTAGGIAIGGAYQAATETAALPDDLVVRAIVTGRITQSGDLDVSDIRIAGSSRGGRSQGDGAASAHGMAPGGPQGRPSFGPGRDGIHDGGDHASRVGGDFGAPEGAPRGARPGPGPGPGFGH